MKISFAKAHEIIEQPGWEIFAENSRGEVYWNDLTGEIIWIDNEDGNSNLSVPKNLIKP